MSRKVDITEPKVLSLIGNHLKRLQEYGAAAEIFHKVGDIPSLVEMNVEAKNWKEVLFITFIILDTIKYRYV